MLNLPQFVLEKDGDAVGGGSRFTTFTGIVFAGSTFDLFATMGEEGFFFGSSNRPLLKLKYLKSIVVQMLLLNSILYN